MTINNLTIPYPDFKYSEVINPDEFDLNNSAIKTKVDEIISAVNSGAGGGTSFTSPTGGTKLTISDASTDLLEAIKAQGPGFSTFYATPNCVNAPQTGRPLRGISHMTNTNILWIWAIDNLNNFYTNYLDNGTWLGWSGAGAWKNLTMLNGYQCTAGRQVRYTKVNGVVSIQGELLANSPAGSTSANWIGTLPAGYRPSQVLVYTVAQRSTSNSNATIVIDSGGNIQLYGVLTASLPTNLANINFVADQ